MTLELDEDDKAFVDSLVPEGCIPMTLMAVVAWLDPDGSLRWRQYVQSDATTTQCLGLLDMVKHRLLVYADSAQTDEDDEDE
jgi:hypothetical protein